MSVRRSRLGTATRLTAFLGLILATVLGLALTGLLRAFSSQSDASTTRSLVAEVQALARAAAQRPAGQSLPVFTDNYLRARVLPDGETLVVALPNGALVGSAGSDALVHSPQLTSWLAGRTGSKTHLTVAHRHYLAVAVPVGSGGVELAQVIAAADLAQPTHDLQRVRALAIGEALIALLAGCLGTYLLLRRLLRRVRHITATAEDIGSGALDRRLRHTGDTDEVGQLATTFDAMADQLADAMQTQRRLLSDVSHQLRTPLTVARGHLEVLARTNASDPDEVHATVALVLDEIEHMKAMVERLLMLGRAMEPDFLEPEPVDLRSFCLDLVDTAQVLASRRWLLPAVPDVVVVVDAAKLRGAVLNLIDNAVRATRDGDVIAVVVGVDNGDVVIAVEDSGPGIPPERRVAVLERFARPGAADSEGSGLGLAIVRAVAEAHGGSVTVGESAYGGCRVALRLPVATGEAATDDVIAVVGEEPTCVS
jgi:signal transduction histidine kinase